MGNHNSGRRPHPTRLQVLRGNPGRRALNTREPHPPPADDSFDTPPAPVADDPVAAAEWRRLAPMLRQCGLVSPAETAALIALCQQWARYLDTHDKVRALGMLVKNADGVPVRNPYLRLADAALDHCRRLWSELGLTPSSRSRIIALPPAELQQTSKWSGLL